MKIIAIVSATIGALALLALALVYSGAFNVAAGAPDSAFTHWLMETVRERSIESRSGEIEVPPLDGPELIAAGAGHYAEMCAVCHLAPGMRDSELRAGLHPKPPDLAEHGAHDAAEAFWIIKNGVRMTGMPAWGVTHDDDSIWELVAFVRKLPEMSPEEYRSMTAEAAGGHTHAPAGGHDAPARDEASAAGQPTRRFH